MYNGYFLNVSTGEILRTSDPKDNPCIHWYPSFNVNGWSQITEDFYHTLKLVQGFGFVMGVKSESES